MAPNCTNIAPLCGLVKHAGPKKYYNLLKVYREITADNAVLIVDLWSGSDYFISNGSSNSMDKLYSP